MMLTSSMSTRARGSLDATNLARPRGPIVAATDASAACDDVVAMARVLATADAAPVRLVSAIALTTLPATDLAIAVNPSPWNASRLAARRQAVETQCARLGRDGFAPEIEVAFGTIGRAAADAATALAARLVVCPLGHHHLLDRLLSEEVALHVARHADVPVLAVPEGMTALPARIVVAVDFSAFSRRAAIAALDVIAEGGTVYLAHVLEPMERMAQSIDGLGPALDRAVDEQFDRVRATMRGLRPDVAVDVVRLGGVLEPALVEYAAEIGAELIAAGSHGDGFFERLVLGSTTTRLLRSASCAVLVVPPPSALGEEAAWLATLRAFSVRHAGRRCRIEVDDEDIGAQVLVRDYPFLGAAFDRHDGRLEIMVGDGRAGGRHVTRSIARVVEVEVSPDERGVESLRVVHAGGETRVHFPR